MLVNTPRSYRLRGELAQSLGTQVSNTADTCGASIVGAMDPAEFSGVKPAANGGKGFVVWWQGRPVTDFPDNNSATVGFAFALRHAGLQQHAQALPEGTFQSMITQLQTLYSDRFQQLAAAVAASAQASGVSRGPQAAASAAASSITASAPTGATVAHNGSTLTQDQSNTHSYSVHEICRAALGRAIADWQNQQQAAIAAGDTATAAALQRQGLSQEALRWVCNTVADAVVPPTVSLADMPMPFPRSPSVRALAAASGMPLPPTDIEMAANPSQFAHSVDELALPPALPLSVTSSFLPGASSAESAGHLAHPAADAALPFAFAQHRQVRTWEEGVILNGLWKSNKDPFTSTRVRLRLPQPRLFTDFASHAAPASAASGSQEGLTVQQPVVAGGYTLCLGSASISNVEVQFDPDTGKGSFRLNLPSAPAPAAPAGAGAADGSGGSASNTHTSSSATALRGVKRARGSPPPSTASCAITSRQQAVAEADRLQAELAAAAAAEVPVSISRDQRVLRRVVDVGPISLVAQPSPGGVNPVVALQEATQEAADSSNIHMSPELAAILRKWYNVHGQTRQQGHDDNETEFAADEAGTPSSKRRRTGQLPDGRSLALSTLHSGLPLCDLPEWSWPHVEPVLGVRAREAAAAGHHWSQLPPWSGAPLDAQGTVAAASALVRTASASWRQQLETMRSSAQRMVMTQYRTLLQQQQHAAMAAAVAAAAQR